jgi:uncharacterized membrane protein
MTAFAILFLTYLLLGVMRVQDRRRRARYAMSLMFLTGGTLHFAAPEPFLKMMPPFLPRPRELVYLSGLLEILGGAAFLREWGARPVGLGLAALLVAVFPANAYVAVANVDLGGYMSSPVYQWLRLPFQLVLIAWALWSGGFIERRNHRPGTGESPDPPLSA